MTHSQYPYCFIHRIFSFNQHHTALCKQAFTRNLERIVGGRQRSSTADRFTGERTHRVFHIKHHQPLPVFQTQLALGVPREHAEQQEQLSLPTEEITRRRQLAQQRRGISVPEFPGPARDGGCLTFRYSPRSCPPMTGGVKFSLRKTSYTDSRSIRAHGRVLQNVKQCTYLPDDGPSLAQERRSSRRRTRKRRFMMRTSPQKKISDLPIPPHPQAPDSRHKRPPHRIKPHPRDIKSVDHVKVRVDMRVEWVVAHSAGETVAVGLGAVVLRGVVVEIGLWRYGSVWERGWEVKSTCLELERLVSPLQGIERNER